MHISNPFVSNIMSAYEIRSYVVIDSIAQYFLTIKQIVAKYFFEIFSIEIPILVERLLVILVVHI